MILSLSLLESAELKDIGLRSTKLTLTVGLLTPPIISDFFLARWRSANAFAMNSYVQSPDEL